MANITSELTSGAARTRPRRKLNVGVRVMKQNMKLIIIVALSAMVAAMAACKRGPSGFPLNMATVQQIDSGSLTFEERGGKITVSVVDRFGDAHLHVLNHEGISRKDALDVLKAKQKELERRNPKRVGGSD